MEQFLIYRVLIYHMANSKHKLREDDTEIMVLSVLAERRAYGYLIMKEVASRSGRATSVSPSLLYPLLARLERDGDITSDWDEVKADPRADSPGRRRKWYQVTEKGRRRLGQRVQAHRLYVRMMSAFLGSHGNAEGEA